MPRSSATSALPAAAVQGLQALGRDLAIARKRRRLTQALLAERMLVNVETVQRLERGDPTVSLGIVASALFVFGLGRRLASLAAPSTDGVGEAEAIRALPRRVRRPAAADIDLDF
ncbi:helix-turn-helix domain-containing protein [Glacieibacterium megasporae]|uniref:helix-turn-helix domain-containing protein n=1 Tax=Glacieibacterium megasporae TaxID=2835787 RepID=UPI001C1DEC58|nr:helix-turn-helix transcriptional regulator [Polymorphobacter megasporae]UAJ12486.1 helix-turn-helix domain-containing protein [Polymorphobacter megasporae]